MFGLWIEFILAPSRAQAGEMQWSFDLKRVNRAPYWSRRGITTEFTSKIFAASQMHNKRTVQSIIYFSEEY